MAKECLGGDATKISKFCQSCNLSCQEVPCLRAARAARVGLPLHVPFGRDAGLAQPRCRAVVRLPESIHGLGAAGRRLALPAVRLARTQHLEVPETLPVGMQQKRRRHLQTRCRAPTGGYGGDGGYAPSPSAISNNRFLMQQSSSWRDDSVSSPTQCCAAPSPSPRAESSRMAEAQFYDSIGHTLLNLSVASQRGGVASPPPPTRPSQPSPSMQRGTAAAPNPRGFFFEEDVQPNIDDVIGPSPTRSGPASPRGHPAHQFHGVTTPARPAQFSFDDAGAEKDWTIRDVVDSREIIAQNRLREARAREMDRALLAQRQRRMANLSGTSHPGASAPRYVAPGDEDLDVLL